MKKLLQWYVASYVFVACFGILQFLAGTRGIDLLVSQWFIPGVFPRVNGFSYEPSYFVLYNSCGWGMLLYLVVEKVNILPRKMMLFALFVTTAAAILSSSRSGIAVDYAFFMMFALRCFLRVRKGHAISRGFWFFAVIGIAVPVLALVYLIYKDPMIFTLFTAGLGVMNGSSHSVTPRLVGMLNTIQVAMNHPLIGTGLGGVGPAIADKFFPGISFEQYQMFRIEGTNIFLESFATGGLIGGMCMLFYFISLYIPVLRNRGDEHPVQKTGAAVLFGLAIELLLLVMEPSLVRMHLWMDIAVVSAVNYQVLIRYHQRRKASSTGSRLG